MAFKELIQQAIRFEEEAYAFYDAGTRLVKSEQARTVLRELAEEEAGHKAKLEQVLQKGASWAVPSGRLEETVDLKIGDYLMPAKLTEESDFQDALMIAIKREQASYDFYTQMGRLVSPDARKVFQFLANEELKHKNKVQSIYDETVYKQF